MAVIIGLLVGAVRARIGKRPFLIPDLHAIWLVLVAFIPQWAAFYLPLTRRAVTTEWAATALISSQAILLLFAWFNRRHRAFWVLGLGLILNLTVIVLNGGLMPISRETLTKLKLDAPITDWQMGSRVGGSKDILLSPAQTRLEWLSDRFVLPGWFPYKAAFSLGDLLIALGAIWLLWESGGLKMNKKPNQITS
ncbi:MAG: DUF5317 domain-containing protein [Chloroflexi bacterium]|nr:DUF5317 domain-containing protein [Chloroflexota bacterium]